MSYSENPSFKIIQKMHHKYPFLFVDRVLSYDIENMKIKAFKNISINEWIFQGHFPSRPIYPGVLIIEGFAQCLSILAHKKSENKINNKKDNFFALTKVNSSKFLNFVVPGDRLVFDVEVIKNFNDKYLVAQGIAYVDEKKVCETEFTVMNVS